jgi:hypothetical protein
MWRRGMYIRMILVGKPEEKRLLGRPKRRWVEWILERWNGLVWIGFICLRIGTSGGLF